MYAKIGEKNLPDRGTAYAKALRKHFSIEELKQVGRGWSRGKKRE